MKNLTFKLRAILLCIVLSSPAFAQTGRRLDDQLKNVDLSSVTSGIIYERVSPMANLYAFNYDSTGYNIANYALFEQALSELHRASNKTKLVSHHSLRNTISSDRKTKGIVNVGIINTPFEILNYKAEDEQTGGLILHDTLYEQIQGRPPFYSLYAVMVSPLKNSVSGGSITFKFSNNLIFNNGSKTIKSLRADLGDGVYRNIIVNGVIALSQVTIQNNFPNGKRKQTYKIIFSDNLTLTTFSDIYFTNPVNVNIVDCEIDDNLIEEWHGPSNRLAALENYQGYGENTSVKGQLEARIYYRTNNGNTQKKLRKPIIIIDGFDPGDTRKIEDCDCASDPVCAERYLNDDGVFDPSLHRSIINIMRYLNPTNNQTENLIRVLRNEGYDVIIVNFPTYETNGQVIDGGADFIERNARTVVKLIQDVNGMLIANNSTEKLSIIAPSMGGQISRYALAWMEKENLNHNTRLWISVDSPHLGANIPIGDQALIFLLGEENVKAEDLYNNSLGSIASKEQLIEFHHDPMINQPFVGPVPAGLDTSYLNGQVTEQGMPANSGNPYYKQYYHNEFTNGLPGSHGFPQNLRKIAVVNGSLSGKTIGQNHEKVLDIRGYQRVCIKPASWFGIGGGPSWCFTIKVAEVESYFLPEDSNPEKIARFRKQGDYTNLNSPNLNSRGNMDIVPGGYYDSQDQINVAVTGAPAFDPNGSFWEYPGESFSEWFSNMLGGFSWDTWTNKPIHSFIPTFSSIAHKQPNQSWFNPLDRNLVCSDETYFDSYYGEAQNSQHTSLNYNMVNWVLKELAEDPQEPYFPVNPASLSGPDIICSPNTTYTFDPCDVPGDVLTWAISNNLNEISHDDDSITVSGKGPAYNGPATITATFKNGVVVTKNVYLGTLFPTIQDAYCPTTSAPCNLTGSPNSGGYFTYTLTVPSGSPTLTNNDYEWAKISGNFSFTNGTATGYIGKTALIHIDGANPTNSPMSFKVRARNGCGWGDWIYYTWNDGTTGNSNPPNNNYFAVSPNPATTGITQINVTMTNTSLQVPAGTIFNVYLYAIPPINGPLRTGYIYYNGPGAASASSILDITTLASGPYIIHVTIPNSQPESHNFVKQ